VFHFLNIFVTSSPTTWSLFINLHPKQVDATTSFIFFQNKLFAKIYFIASSPSHVGAETSFITTFSHNVIAKTFFNYLIVGLLLGLFDCRGLFVTSHTVFS
jgi:hypothetical protein